uniref:Uncharacterized protein n=1 Tax=Anguilla anguilla TaxID=7936 RepID=A0A0E9WA64_ANGAN
MSTTCASHYIQIDVITETSQENIIYTVHTSYVYSRCFHINSYCCLLISTCEHKY